MIHLFVCMLLGIFISTYSGVSLDDAQAYVRIVRNHNVDTLPALYELRDRGVTAQGSLQALAEHCWNRALANEMDAKQLQELFFEIAILEKVLVVNAAQDARNLIHAVNRDPWTAFPILDTVVNTLPYTTSQHNLGFGIFIWTLVSHETNFLIDDAIPSIEQLLGFVQTKQTDLITSLGRKGADIYYGPDYLLAWAAWCNCIEFIEYFASRGVDVPTFGYYAIEAALQKDQPCKIDRSRIVLKLLGLGATVSSTALALAKDQQLDGIWDILNSHYSILTDPEGYVAQAKRLKKEFCSIM